MEMFERFTDAIHRMAKRHPKPFQQEIERLPDAYPYSCELSMIHTHIK